MDESALLDSAWMRELEPAVAALAAGDPSARAFDFNYPAFVDAFRKAKDELGIANLVPYQARQSGPSIEVAKGVRSLMEVAKRGRWKSMKSVQRYEKAGKLAAAWRALPAATQAVCERAELTVADMIVGRRAARSIT